MKRFLQTNCNGLPDVLFVSANNDNGIFFFQCSFARSIGFDYYPVRGIYLTYNLQPQKNVYISLFQNTIIHDSLQFKCYICQVHVSVNVLLFGWFSCKGTHLMNFLIMFFSIIFFYLCKAYLKC